jgi:hypothetical protein
MTEKPCVKATDLFIMDCKTFYNNNKIDKAGLHFEGETIVLGISMNLTIRTIGISTFGIRTFGNRIRTFGA